ncbi:ABC-F family ATP-binding cassette domain-containing protein [Orientia tsutsugamushi]|uniref:ABC transporter family protein n=1 Tax=Orientia tsutsugamushi str. TA716 TaxID=1359175 RepID=A0A0F3PCZ5_ORITS|nr:ATP-binding cassette domain-containing protein [Orientia tsutsugamushi]KJV77104.1 ABC transporter family protein [Orientia tsutsugamushi str. TA716]
MKLLPIYYIKYGELSFANQKIFDNLNIYLYPGDKICLIGKNGSGKSSLMKIINSDYQLNKGEIFQHSATKIAYLQQNVTCNLSLKVYDFITQSIPNKENYYQAEIFIEKLQINANKTLRKLSGGQLRRVQLAKVLASHAEILLLDEPTNHLDIQAIEWLESYVKSYKGSIICISHDRAFLTAISNKVWWLDRCVLHQSNKGFQFFEQWQAQIIDQEESNLIKLNKKINTEQLWLHQGISARRKRNQRRLSNLKTLREQLRFSSQRLAKASQKVQFYHSNNESNKAKFIIRAENVCFKYNDQFVIKNFNINIIKGNKIGIIGPNGTGKSTLLKLFTKSIKPSSGSIEYGTTLEITYFDQNKSSLNPNHTLQQTLCPTGGNQIFLSDRTIHAGAYLKSFMFDPKLLSAKVSTLSGGEATRLLLAKALIKPGNLLILDEPTNDLDIDTIEILLDILSDYSGTLIVVSHDRDFLNRLVTNTLVFEGNGNIINVIGGYQDYLEYYSKLNQHITNTKLAKNNKTVKHPTSKLSTKLSYKFKRMLDSIPEEITQLETQVKDLEKKLADPNLYQNNPDKFLLFSKELETSKLRIEELFDTWQKIENRNI